MGFLILLYSLTNFEIHKYYKNEPKFNGVFSRNNEYADVGTHWIALFCLFR